MNEAMSAQVYSWITTAIVPRKMCVYMYDLSLCFTRISWYVRSVFITFFLYTEYPEKCELMVIFYTPILLFVYVFYKELYNVTMAFELRVDKFYVHWIVLVHVHLITLYLFQ